MLPVFGVFVTGVLLLFRNLLLESVFHSVSGDLTLVQARLALSWFVGCFLSSDETGLLAL